MPRPCKKRRVCCVPKAETFGPRSCGSCGNIVMTVDEYETIRLIDVEGMNQEQCAQQMGIARTTAQAIYNSARKKIGYALTGGLDLVIRGGEYQLCNCNAESCGSECRCPKKDPQAQGQMPCRRHQL